MLFRRKKALVLQGFLKGRVCICLLYRVRNTGLSYPEKDLKRVMFVRGVLDGVAAVVFLLKGEKEAAKAVLQARKEFKHIRPDFESSRLENMTDTVADTIPEKVSYSILWKFHACGKKSFSKLN